MYIIVKFTTSDIMTRVEIEIFRIRNTKIMSIKINLECRIWNDFYQY